MQEALDQRIAAQYVDLIRAAWEGAGMAPDVFTTLRFIALDFADAIGAAALVYTPDHRSFAVVNTPVLVTPAFGITFDQTQALQFAMGLPPIDNGRYSVQGGNIYFTFCAETKSLAEVETAKLLDGLVANVEPLRHDVFDHFQKVCVQPGTQPAPLAEPKLPNISMKPLMARRVFRILAACDLSTRAHYIRLMERWVAAGHLVETSGRSISLLAKKGNTVRWIAGMFPGGAPMVDRLNNPVHGRTALIVLAWWGLQKGSSIPPESSQRYMKRVSRSIKLTTTPAAAQIRDVSGLSDSQIRALLAAMKMLAMDLRPTRQSSSKPVHKTRDNLQNTLKACDSHARQVFSVILEKWKAQEGVVLCNKPGRIYLRLRTKSHQVGRASKLRRDFNLAVLAAPSGKRGARIQVTWGLADNGQAAYLDCIPTAVADFERLVSGLPGFGRHGTITDITIEKSLTLPKAAKFARAMLKLSAAERKSK